MLTWFVMPGMLLTTEQECSRLAFLKKGRSLQASDLTEEVHSAFLNLFPEIDNDAENNSSKL